MTQLPVEKNETLSAENLREMVFELRIVAFWHLRRISLVGQGCQLSSGRAANLAAVISACNGMLLGNPK